MERIAKVIAAAGVCSRREAEKLIAQGRVTVDGEVVSTPAFCVAEGMKVAVDGERLPKVDSARVWLYYKPAGLVTTHRDEKGRPTVFDRLPAAMPRVVSVGRLDLNSEGLLLLTNSGELSRSLELPSNGWARRYKVRVFGRIDERSIANLAEGCVVEGVRYAPIKVEVENKKGANSWLIVTLREGKNREIRRVMKHVGLEVSRLIRLSYGPFQLGAMKEGEVREVAQKVLKEQGLAK